MNKTLLLIIVDFLFLNLIALTRWERAEPVRPVQPPLAESGAGSREGARTRDQDLVETMRQSLVDEQAARARAQARLEAGESALAERERGLESERSRAAALSSDLAAAHRAQADLGERYAEASREAGSAREDLARTRRELDESTAAALRQRAALEELRREQEEARRRIAGLTLAASLAEQEKAQLVAEAARLRTDVQTERDERMNVEKTASQLAQGVGQLAENSGELTREIRDNQPISANTLFHSFEVNRIRVRLSATRPGLFGPVNRSIDSPAAVVADSTGVYAVLHVEDTLFSLSAVADDWENLEVRLTGPAGMTGSATEIRFLAADPRVIAIPLPPAMARALAPKAYRIAGDPFHFPDATLIERDGAGYGDVEFKLDPGRLGYVRVDNRLFKRLFGDFAPSRGDLVLSRTGELLGVMANADYCALIRGFPGAAGMHTGAGEANPGGTAGVLEALDARVRAMPLDLQ